ncbi:hypothetical protein [Haloferula sp.]|uniref:hypothetical protein n=1 Tax=Haloferula sp. TaxID=2497595 RepID=UPI00329BBBDE
MRKNFATWTLGMHAGLLLLASTRFSVITWLWSERSWTWNYLQCSFQNGWGRQYQSDYSLAMVASYIGAYLIGIIGFALAWRHLSAVCKTLGLILAVLGLVSFLIEGSHWAASHHLSWIFICPLASLLLAGIAIIQLTRPNKATHPTADRDLSSTVIPD